MEQFDSLFKIDDIFALWLSTVGLERETMRITEDGDLATTPHPKALGNRSFHPYIQTDFAESQLEFITPPYESSETLINWLSGIHQVAYQVMESDNEYFWPLSTPAYVPEDRDSIKVAQLDNEVERGYRTHLAAYYGKDVQLISGIHYNFQINPEVLKRKQPESMDRVSFMNAIYSKLARNYLRYRWILTYLMGASPYIADNYATELYGKPHKRMMRSFRQSRYGYQNKADVYVRYDSLEHFIEDLEQAVASGQLSVEKELYRDVRFRRGNPYRELLQKGVSYLEFRNIDLNPFATYGIEQGDIDFIKLFIITLLYLPDVETNEAVDKGNTYNFQTAEADPTDLPIDMDEIRQFLGKMKTLATTLDRNRPQKASLINLIESKEAMIDRPVLTLAGRIIEACPSPSDFLAFGIDLAKDYRELYQDKPYLLHGFEQLELSTQDVLKEALIAGIEFDVVDTTGNLIRLEHDDHVEFVKSANMTSHDTLISYYLMEDKVVTKKLLADVGVRVPAGVSFKNPDEAKAYFPQIEYSAFVIKPKDTNFGLGITIFTERPSQSAYDEALKLAFAEDDTVLVEEFVQGTELRFYVQDGSTRAVVERQPAQVVGDGKHSISELIDIENTNPLRGERHLAPLTYIEKGSAERLQLSEQNLDFDSIPAEGEIVYLRRNSNISTGGVSIDRTDAAHSSYHRIAEHSAEALGANFCGVDIILTDYSQEARFDNYAVIEANFNPMITLHRHPGRGQAHRVGRDVLKQLFPEVAFSTEGHFIG